MNFDSHVAGFSLTGEIYVKRDGDDHSLGIIRLENGDLSIFVRAGNGELKRVGRAHSLENGCRKLAAHAYLARQSGSLDFSSGPQLYRTIYSFGRARFVIALDYDGKPEALDSSWPISCVVETPARYGHDEADGLSVTSYGQIHVLKSSWRTLSTNLHDHARKYRSLADAMVALARIVFEKLGDVSAHERLAFETASRQGAGEIQRLMALRADEPWASFAAIEDGMAEARAAKNRKRQGKAP